MKHPKKVSRRAPVAKATASPAARKAAAKKAAPKTKAKAEAKAPEKKASAAAAPKAPPTPPAGVKQWYYHPDLKDEKGNPKKVFAGRPLKAGDLMPFVSGTRKVSDFANSGEVIFTKVATSAQGVVQNGKPAGAKPLPGRSVSEAMREPAAPRVPARIDAISDWIDDEECGVTVGPGNIDALARVLTEKGNRPVLVGIDLKGSAVDVLALVQQIVALKK